MLHSSLTRPAKKLTTEMSGKWQKSWQEGARGGERQAKRTTEGPDRGEKIGTKYKAEIISLHHIIIEMSERVNEGRRLKEKDTEEVTEERKEGG